MPALRPLRRADAALLAVFTLGACAPHAVTTQVAYARLHLDGDLALAASERAQDVSSAFGLGSDQECPYVRVLANWGVPEFGVAGFLLSEQGSGVLDESFGGLPAGTTVETRLRLGVAKFTAAAALQAGPVTLSPGLLFDVFAIDFRASNAGNREEVDDVVGVPMPFLRATAPFGAFAATAEVGWLDFPGFIDFDSRFADVEAMLAWRPHDQVELFAGYRLVVADAVGENGADTVDLDLRVSGWFVGGGVRF